MALVNKNQNQERNEISLLPGITVVGLLGRPGSGKGTQCCRLSKKLPICHISAGEVLRAEMVRPGNKNADNIRKHMLEGTVGPKEITVDALRSYIVLAARDGVRNFILDGFPRDVAQAHYFEQKVCLISGVLVLDCSEDTCTRRLLTRARFDDNYENIQRRLDTFANTTAKVIDLFRGRGKLWSVNAEDEIETVGRDFEELFTETSNEE